MTLQQVLKEIDVVRNITADSTKISFTFDEVGTDDELINYTKENGLILHSPSMESPYFFFFLYNGKIDAIVRGKRKEVSIKY